MGDWEAAYRCPECRRLAWFPHSVCKRCGAGPGLWLDNRYEEITTRWVYEGVWWKPWARTRRLEVRE